MPTALKLTVHQGDDVIAQETFERDVVKIGRLASAHLKLDDPKVSRIHAVIEATQDGVGYAIIDMGSTEGTVLNGRKISKERLSDGDELQLGDLRVMVNMALDAASLSSGHNGGSTNGRGVAEAATAPGLDVPPPPPGSAAAPVAPGNGSDVPPPPPPASSDVPPMGPSDMPPPAPAASSDVPPVPPMSATPGLDVPPPAPEDSADVPEPRPLVHPEASLSPPLSPAPIMAMDAVVPGRAAAPAVLSGGPASASAAASMPGVALDPSSEPVPVPVERTAMMPVPAIAAAPVARAQSFPGLAPAPAAPSYPTAPSTDPWGSVPNNLASENVPDSERVLEVRTVWGTNVLDTFTSRIYEKARFGRFRAINKPAITVGDERRVVGWGPFQRIETCDVQVPATGLPSKSYVLAESTGPEGSTRYRLNIPPGLDGYIQRADGALIPLAQLYQGAEGARAGEVPGSVRYDLRPAETVYLVYGNVIFQIRYIRQNVMVPPSMWAEMNYTWLNILLVAAFVHLMAIVAFISTPKTTAALSEDLFRNPNRFAQFKLTPEQKRKTEQTLLARLKARSDKARGEAARAKGKEGKMGSKDAKAGKDKRAAAKGPKKDDAQSALDRLLGNTPGKGARGRLMGTGKLGGELQAALGGISGREVGASAGIGGLGARGVGKGGGGLSMNSVGLGALGTRGRGGGLGGASYGEGAGRLGVKKERDINISAGAAVIQGSLDKELIRRVIKRHIAQIRYCYERELQSSPGLFGKVATRFVISAAGRVQQAKVEQTTLKNAKVERCVLSKIRTWRFPKPKGGGIVIVKYPFIFKTSG